MLVFFLQAHALLPRPSIQFIRPSIVHRTVCGMNVLVNSTHTKTARHTLGVVPPTRQKQKLLGQLHFRARSSSLRNSHAIFLVGINPDPVQCGSRMAESQPWPNHHAPSPLTSCCLSGSLSTTTPQHAPLDLCLPLPPTTMPSFYIHYMPAFPCCPRCCSSRQPHSSRFAFDTDQHT